jgi:hypothetical protein
MIAPSSASEPRVAHRCASCATDRTPPNEPNPGPSRAHSSTLLRAEDEPAPHGVSLGGSTVAPGRTYVAPGTGTARTSRREAASPKRSAAVRRPGGTRSRPPRGDVQRGAALGDNRRSGNGTLGAMHGAQPTPRARRRSTRPGNDERRPVCIGGGGFQAPDRKWAAFVKCGPAATAHRRPYPVTAAATSPQPSPRARPPPTPATASPRSAHPASPLRRPPKQIRTIGRRTRRQHRVGLRVRPQTPPSPSAPSSGPATTQRPPRGQEPATTAPAASHAPQTPHPPHTRTPSWPHDGSTRPSPPPPPQPPHQPPPTPPATPSSPTSARPTTHPQLM